ncbi:MULTISPECIES: hypothetical protein [unclassified Romboutsia]|uniref:hypothetical protein n=1 Tax=unclassified Romboutsia TaxID=2626894 RepID=UPI000F06E99F|nr:MULTISPECIES: hypothetical protein [unclassified Romboutsia]
MLKDINNRIREIKNEVAKKQVLEKKLNELKTDLYKSESDLSDLEYKLKKELNDVEKLKKLSLSSIVSTIMNNKEMKIEKEEKEYITAKIEYDKCNSKVILLKKNISDMEERLNYLKTCEIEYSKLLREKIDLINTYGDENDKKKILDMEKYIDEYLMEIKELEESISVGNCLMGEIKETKKLLESAKTWSNLDLFGGDLISSLAKHSKVDEAQRHFSIISNLLERFNKELEDVRISSLNFSTTSRTLDIFFDNIFSDISVNSQINKSYDDVCNLERRVNRIIGVLKENKTRISDVISAKREEYDEFIDTI